MNEKQTGTVNPLQGDIQFISSRSPVLTDGSYSLTVTQNLTVNNTDESLPAVLQSFQISGPRVVLNPKKIKSVFPPAGSFGDRENVLPHVLIDSTSLPWQRTVCQGAGDDIPWLALLVFDEGEAPAFSTVPASDLVAANDSSPFWPGMSDLSDPSGSVTVIDVGYATLNALLPGYDDLQYLAHIRKTEVGGEDSTFSVVVANRLPGSNGKSIVHLVSLESRYKVNPDTTTGSEFVFDFQTASGSDQIRMVSLYHWSFTSLAPAFDFASILAAVNLSTFQMPDPSSSNGQLTEMYQAGKVGLLHQFRNGDQSTSWYSGPLLPGPGFGATAEADPPRCSDALLNFYNDMGMFDVSYAAAWEIGRLLMLRNKKASAALYIWKREQIQAQAKQVNAARYPHLQFGLNAGPQGSPPLPPEVTEFLKDLNLLRHLPFQYLVPRQALLPVESIRFFQVDMLWIQRLIQGAFIIGEAPGQETPMKAPHLYYPVLTGFLLRSEVVSGYPDLQVTGYTDSPDGKEAALNGDEAYVPVQLERLSANVLICLFDQSVQTVDIHLKPEVLHFELDTGTSKYLRDENGVLSQTVEVTVPLDQNRRITISSPKTGDGLVELMKQEITENNWNFPDFTSAEFALEMITGVKNVRFTAGNV